MVFVGTLRCPGKMQTTDTPRTICIFQVVVQPHVRIFAAPRALTQQAARAGGTQLLVKQAVLGTGAGDGEEAAAHGEGGDEEGGDEEAGDEDDEEAGGEVDDEEAGGEVDDEAAGEGDAHGAT